MNRPLFVSIDGPKGTGKTTLLEAVTQALRLDGNKVIRLCERKNDPCRGETMALVNQLARSPCRDLEFKVCERFAESRAWISRHVLPRQPADSIILIDRWYPSDAAFSPHGAVRPDLAPEPRTKGASTGFACRGCHSR